MMWWRKRWSCIGKVEYSSRDEENLNMIETKNVLKTYLEEEKKIFNEYIRNNFTTAIF